MRYSIEFHDGLSWSVAQGNIGNKSTAEQIVAVLITEYPDYQFRIVSNELITF